MRDSDGARILLLLAPIRAVWPCSRLFGFKAQHFVLALEGIVLFSEGVALGDEGAVLRELGALLFVEVRTFHAARQRSTVSK